ncbi:hypothetical protein ACJQWK_01209 [Exserohilum turcicum]
MQSQQSHTTKVAGSLRRHVMASSMSVEGFMTIVVEAEVKLKKFGHESSPRPTPIGRGLCSTVDNEIATIKDSTA